MKYEIVEANDPARIKVVVAELISQGFVPLGGVAVVAWRCYNEDAGHWTEFCYSQAMIKHGTP
jgi:hypothetical protein